MDRTLWRSAANDWFLHYNPIDVFFLMFTGVITPLLGA